MDIHPPFPLGHTLERVISECEDKDCVAFDPVQLPSNIGRSQSPFRRTPVHTNSMQLEDDELSDIRQEIESLEHQKLDNSAQIETLEKQINDLNSKLSSNSLLNPRKVVITSPRILSTSKRSRPVVQSKTEDVHPPDEATYQRLYYEIKQEYDTLRAALSKEGKITRKSANNLILIAPPI